MHCGKCSLLIDDEDYIQCDSHCKLRYHKHCTELPDETFNSLRGDRRRRWKCEWCVNCIELNRSQNVPIDDIDPLLPDLEIGVNTFAPGNLFNSQDDWIEFVDNVNYAYDQIGCYRKNLFNVPSGTVGKEFVK